MAFEGRCIPSGSAALPAVPTLASSCLPFHLPARRRLGAGACAPSRRPSPLWSGKTASSYVAAGGNTDISRGTRDLTPGIDVLAQAPYDRNRFAGIGSRYGYATARAGLDFG